MQILFAKNRDPYLLETHLPKIFDQSIQNSFNLYLFQLYLVQHICKQAKNVADKIQNKYLPSVDDKNFVPVLYENELIQSLVQNKKLQKLFDKGGFVQWVDEDVLKNIYSEFAKLDWYKAYADKATEDKNHLETLLELYRFLRKMCYSMRLSKINFIIGKMMIRSSSALSKNAEVIASQR